MEPHTHDYGPLPPRAHFFRRLGRSFAIALGIILAALGIGMAGYRWLEGLSWIDSFLNAAMILSGMGPASELHQPAGKFFAGCYALFSGIVFIAMSAVMLGPVLHRFLHRFHLGMQPRNKP